MEKNKQEISISIKRIKLSSFNINEMVSLGDAKKANVDLQQSLSFSLEKRLIYMWIKVKFSSQETGEVFMEGHVQNVFELNELADFKNDSDNNNSGLPEPLLITILSLSVSHTRALLSQAAMGTVYQDLYLPLINPMQISQELFKSLIKENDMIFMQGEK